MIEAECKAEGGTGNQLKSRGTDGTKFLTPAQTGARWSFHPESVRRKLRKGEIESVIIGGRRLVPMAEIERVENEGRIVRTA